MSKLWFLAVCWFPREVGSLCDRCTEARVFLQYASNSSSPKPCAPSGHWSPREAEGKSMHDSTAGFHKGFTKTLAYLLFPSVKLCVYVDFMK